MSCTVTVHVAKTHLSRLIERARSGEEVIIARGKIPVVRLVPVSPRPRGRVFGAMRGRARIGKSFFKPLPSRELAAWER